MASTATGCNNAMTQPQDPAALLAITARRPRAGEERSSHSAIPSSMETADGAD